MELGRRVLPVNTHSTSLFIALFPLGRHRSNITTIYLMNIALILKSLIPVLSAPKAVWEFVLSQIKFAVRPLFFTPAGMRNKGKEQYSKL